MSLTLPAIKSLTHKCLRCGFALFVKQQSEQKLNQGVVLVTMID